MRFIDGTTYNEARARVNQEKAWIHEDYMSSGLYMDMTKEEYMDGMNLTKRIKAL